jgi:hypothetical protein
VTGQLEHIPTPNFLILAGSGVPVAVKQVVEAIHVEVGDDALPLMEGVWIGIRAVPVVFAGVNSTDAVRGHVETVQRVLLAVVEGRRIEAAVPTLADAAQ